MFCIWWIPILFGLRPTQPNTRCPFLSLGFSVVSKQVSSQRPSWPFVFFLVKISITTSLAAFCIVCSARIINWCSLEKPQGSQIDAKGYLMRLVSFGKFHEKAVASERQNQSKVRPLLRHPRPMAATWEIQPSLTRLKPTILQVTGTLLHQCHFNCRLLLQYWNLNSSRL